MFTPIRSLLARLRAAPAGRPTQPSAPYGLSEAQIALLRELRTSDPFACFAEVLDLIVRLYSESLLSPAAQSDQIHFLRGKIAGLRQAGTLVDEILTNIDATAKRPAVAESRERTRASTFGSPFWSG